MRDMHAKTNKGAKTLLNALIKKSQNNHRSQELKSRRPGTTRHNSIGDHGIESTEKLQRKPLQRRQKSR